MTRVTPSFVQVMLGVAVAEFAVQYSQSADCGAMLWTPLLFRKRISGRMVTVSWPFTAEDMGGQRRGVREKGLGEGEGDEEIMLPNQGRQKRGG